MMLSPYKFIGLQGSVTSCHEGQSCALPAFDGRICSTHMGHTNFRVLHAAFCFPLYVLDIPAPFSIQQSRGLLWNSTMLSILSKVCHVCKQYPFRFCVFPGTEICSRCYLDGPLLCS